MKKKLLRLLFSLALALFGIHANAQTTTVSGVVTDGAFPMPGVNVLVKGSTKGTTTDIDGKFTFSNLSPKDILVFNYISYKTQEVVVGGQTNFTIKMIEVAGELNEVVIVGYGTQIKKDVTGSIVSIKAKDIVEIVAGNPTSVLQGKMAGVQVENFGGQPGGPSNVFVRGIGSLTNSYPLYVIDGTFADNLNFINTNDIESIQVLKDASAAAIYGSRASNGVVLVTTKRGKSAGISVNLNIRGGIEAPSKRLNYLNSEQFLAYRADKDAGTGFSIDRNSLLDSNGQLIDTDWQDKSLSSGSITDYGLSVTGGGDNSKFYFSTNSFKQDGILVGSGFERINVRLNSQFKIGKFTINESLGLAQSKTQENEWFGFESAAAPILRFNVPENEGGFEAPERTKLGFGGINNYALSVLEDNLNTNKNLIGNVNISYEIIEGLTAKINLGIEYNNGFKSTFRPTYFMSSTDARFNDNPQNDLTHVRSEFTRTQFEPTLEYKKDLNKHSFSALIGYSEIQSTTDVLGTYVGNLPSNDIKTIGAAGVSGIIASVGTREIDGLVSGFGRINYSYAGKYLFTGTIRKDSSSKFGDGHRTGVFPSFSLGWRISDEDFFPQGNVLTGLKLRGGYGELGSQNVGNYLYQTTIGTTSGASFGDTFVNGFAQTQFANDKLQWETSSTINVGADFDFFNGDLTLSTEYYKKEIANLLVAIPIPSTNGTSVPVTQNVGELQNKGFEMELNYHKNKGAFKYDVGFNLGTQNSNLTKLPVPFNGPSVNEGIESVNRFIEGEAPGSFYGYIVDGIYDNQSEINNDPNRKNDSKKTALLPGDFIQRDINGDGIVDDKDRTVLGSPVPDFTYGFNFTGNYKKFDFGIFFNGVSGNEIYNQARSYNTLSPDGNKLTDVLDRWTPQNTTGTFPAARANDPATNGGASSFFVEDGSYLRLKTLSFGYNLTDLLKSKSIENIRLSVTGQNLFVLTGYSGYDPDVSSTSGARSNENSGFFGYRPAVNQVQGRGIDIRAYPNAMSVIFGIQLTF